MASPSTTQQMVPNSFIKNMGPNKSKTGAAAVQNDAHTIGTPANYSDIASMDARLLAIGGIYTQLRLNTMTVNDKRYAIALSDDAEFIK